MRRHKPSKTTGNVRVAKKTNVAKREQTSIIDSANRALGFASLIFRLWQLLESLPWDKLHHLLR